MAYIDKIYGSNEQWMELFDWLRFSNRPQYTRFMYCPFGMNSKTDRPITNTPVYVDRWLWDNCPLPFVKKRLKFMYGRRP